VRDSALRDRIGVALSKGGLSATVVWLLKKIFRVEPYHILEARLERHARLERASRFALHCILSGTIYPTAAGKQNPATQPSIEE